MMDFTAIGVERERGIGNEEGEGEAEFYKLSCLGAIRFQIGRLSLSLPSLSPSSIRCYFFGISSDRRSAFYDAPQ